MGWLTTEELWWNQDGVLMTHAPSTYKIPAVNDCPADLRTKLFRNSNVEDTILRSKATGEPPLLLPFSVFFAIRDAIASVADYRVQPPLDAPATGEAILKAVDAVRAAAQGASMSRKRAGRRMSDWIRALAVAAQAGRAAVLVSIVVAKGSVPRAVGTRMVVGAEGISGTIGGGHLEHKAIEIARGLLADGGAPALHRFALGASLGQCCGGVAQLLFEPLHGSAAWLETICGHADDRCRLRARDTGPR